MGVKNFADKLFKVKDDKVNDDKVNDKINEDIGKGNINNYSLEEVIKDACDKLGVDHKIKKSKPINSKSKPINSKAKDIMIEERMRQKQNIEEMLDFCCENCPSDFIYSLDNFYWNRGYLTDKQAKALEKIYVENL